MIQPVELESTAPVGPTRSRGVDVWAALRAAEMGDVPALRTLLANDPSLVRAEYGYTQPLHLAVRGGQLGAVELLLEHGADPAAGGVVAEDLIVTAHDRGLEDIAGRLEVARAARGRVEPERGHDSPLHAAAHVDDVAAAASALDEEPHLLERADAAGGTPLHRAAAAGARAVLALLLERGADLHARHGAGPGSSRGYAPVDFEPVDLALWTGPFWNVRGDLETARWLVDRGACYDVVVAAALGDRARVVELLDEDPARVNAARPSGKRALSAAVEHGHVELARLLLARGADPLAPEGDTAAQGAALHAAARLGLHDLVQQLLVAGADPNSGIDSSGSATYAAATPELRRVLERAGGRLDVYDLLWLHEDEEALRRVRSDPRTANAGCGGAFAAACSRGDRALLEALLEAGARLPPVVSGCRLDLLRDPALLKLLLSSGMNPNLPSWQHATPLHDVCGRDSRGRALPRRMEVAQVLLDAGASLTARDDEYRSTPLGWAARCGLDDLVELLLARGASVELDAQPAWARPLAWAERRGHADVRVRLRAAGA